MLLQLSAGIPLPSLVALAMAVLEDYHLPYLHPNSSRALPDLLNLDKRLLPIL
jgi:hypothetical protein